MELKPRFGGTVSDRRLTARTRSTTDAPISGRGESVTSFDFPRAASLRRVWGWQWALNAGLNADLNADLSLERMAYHEAGHVVLLGWLGLDCPRAVATASSGLTYLPENRPVPAMPPDPTGELTAIGSALFHAGTMAELIHIGATWSGPVYRQQDDHQRAEAMLREVFGAHSSGAHAFAQRVALHVLAGRWERVQGIAAQLVATGEWLPAI